MLLTPDDLAELTGKRRSAAQRQDDPRACDGIEPAGLAGATGGEMTPLYIFDLDGTLALVDHRRRILSDKSDSRRWEKFYAACVDDQPNKPVIDTLLQLRRAGAECWIWSGRSDEVRSQTVDWLCTHGGFGNPSGTLPAWPFLHPHRFRMRRAGDYMPDDELKLHWLTEMSQADRSRLVAVFDDRDKVVAMWRAAGVPCFQVAPGEF